MTKFGTSSNIPKILHFCWIQGYEAAPKDRIGNVELWSNINPGYAIEFWDEDRILEEFTEPFKSEYLKVDTAVKRSDFARCWILAKYGGWYVDLDLIPLRSLGEWFEDEFVFGRLYKGQYEPVNYKKYDYVLTREYRRIDKNGHAVANGIIGTVKSTMWLKFLRSRFKHREKETLKSFGPHAMTYYMRPRIKEWNAIVVPPTYFLWEKFFFGEPAPFTVSLHPSVNTWGNKDKKDWWNV